MQEIYKKLSEHIDTTRIFLDEPMSKHTTFRVGGPADIFIKVQTIDELKNALKILKENNIKVYIVGNGSNLLVKDKGIRGAVIKLEFCQIEKTDELTFEVGAGVLLAKLSRIAYEESLTGLEFAYGIPGTIGGAVKGNAGAYLREMKDVVVSSTYLDTSDLNLYTINNEEHNFEYRNSRFNNTDDIIISSIIKLEKGNKEEIKEVMDQNSNSRKTKQPLNFPNAGSIFKRGKDYITARLIDEAGLKGYNIGGASVSNLHAGFIINENNASAKDILELIDYIKKTVKEKFDVDLELEIKILGED